MNVTVTESICCTEDKIDEVNGIIRDVKVLGFESKNGYEYAKEAVKKAAPLYEGVDVNIDHDRKTPGTNRGVKEQWGALKNPKFVESVGVVADLHYLTEHQETKTNLERIRKNMSVGLSHVAEVTMAKSTPKDKRKCVESIERVISVDFVRRPATTKNLFESEGNKMLVKAKELAAKATKEHVRTLLESAVDSIEFESTGDDANDIRLACGLVIESQEKKEADEKDKKSIPDTSEITKLMESQNAVTKSLAESITFLMDKEKTRDKRELIQRVLEANSMTYSDLSPDRQQLLESMKDEESMKRLVGTWPPVVRGRRFVAESGNSKSPLAGQPAKDIVELKKRLQYS